MKHIFAEDIKFFEEERQKIKEVFDSLDNQIAQNADDAIGEMLDKFFSDTNVYLAYNEEAGLTVEVYNGDNEKYQISASWNEALESLLDFVDDEDDFEADHCDKIAQIFQTTAAQFSAKAATKRQSAK